MRTFILGVAGVASLIGAAAALPTPALAQQDQTTGEILVYGTDPCPRATDDQVVICRRLPESMRYRIPDPLRPSGTKQQKDSWANRSQSLRTVGATGIGSCSAVGPGGSSGCLIQEINNARAANNENEETNAIPPQ